MKGQHIVATWEFKMHLGKGKRQVRLQEHGWGAGSNVVITADGMAVTIFEEKWDKTKAILVKWKERLVEEKVKVKQKGIRVRGWLFIYVMRTFPAMKLYLKGFHLTLHGWHPGREESGWRSATFEVRRDQEEWEGEEDQGSLWESKSGEPEWVTPVPRLQDDLGALMSLSESIMTLPRRLVRPNKVRAVRYVSGITLGWALAQLFQAPGLFCTGMEFGVPMTARS